MAKKRFTAEQIIGLLREADVKLSQGRNVGQECCCGPLLAIRMVWSFRGGIPLRMRTVEYVCMVTLSDGS